MRTNALSSTPLTCYRIQFSAVWNPAPCCIEMKCLVVVSGPEQSEQDRRLIRLAACMGIPARSIQIQDGEPNSARLFDEFNPNSHAFAISAAALARFLAAPDAPTRWRSLLENTRTELLVFDWIGPAGELQPLAALVDSAVIAVREEMPAEAEISFPETGKSCSRQLAGLSYVRRGGEPIVVFGLREQSAGPAPIVCANGCPMLLRIEKGMAKVFLLGGPSFLDPDGVMSREYELKSQYDRFLPLLIFLRYAFGELCWQNPSPTARLILDDPLLTRQYGFLDYNVLLQSMRRNRYGTSIAFIPWNGWRTSRRDVKRLLSSQRLSLCVHGCDHANREFESEDPDLLVGKAALALSRMRSLGVRTGATFDPVMVFPQERYTVSAIAALRGQPYLAAVNTICVPIDSAPDDLTVRDFISPAITRYHGFPIFQRRYPRRLFDFACDLFLGKPALVVEHHDYFQHGIAPLEEFVAALQRVEPSLRWPNLGEQLMECNLRRPASNGSTEARFFTRRFRLTARDGESGRYTLSKHEPDASRIESVLVGGKPVDFRVEREFLHLELTAEPGRECEVVIADYPDKPRLPGGFRIRHNTRVFLRRALSEFRDNTLSRHSGLHRGAQWVADKLNVTGAGYDDTERYETYESESVNPQSRANP